jgi:hypothetical protein
MRRIAAEVDIEAPPERVWAVLTDLAAYSEWNPFMRRVEGAVVVGERLALSMFSGEGARPLEAIVEVTAAEPPRRLEWIGTHIRVGGRLVPARWPGLMHGERRIALEPIPGGGTRLHMETRFRGLLAPLMRWLDSYQPAFEAMERALKHRVEATARESEEG